MCTGNQLFESFIELDIIDFLFNEHGANRLSSLEIRNFEDRNVLTVPTFWFVLAVIFIKAFFKTIQKEWHGIDQFRMDKFYLVRHCFKRITTTKEHLLGVKMKFFSFCLRVIV